MSFIYLASPYSHPNPTVRQQRYELVLEISCELARNQIPHYSPIVSSHVVGQVGNLPGDHEYWWKTDKVFMDLCSQGIFVTAQGWKQSKGMEAERLYLEKLQKHFLFLSPEEIFKFDWRTVVL
jgi:hypothetical protein